MADEFIGRSENRVKVNQISNKNLIKKFNDINCRNKDKPVITKEVIKRQKNGSNISLGDL